MLINTQANKILINEVAYQIVGKNAPKELPLYVSIRDEYFGDPEKFVQSVESEVDEEGGSGVTVAVTLLTRAVFPILEPILSCILEAAADTFKEAGQDQASQWVRSLFTEKEPQPVFTQAQLEVITETIKEIAKNEADRLGIEASQSKTISDAVIARLALAKV